VVNSSAADEAFNRLSVSVASNDRLDIDTTDNRFHDELLSAALDIQA
jgi:hypothetical protein